MDQEKNKTFEHHRKIDPALLIPDEFPQVGFATLKAPLLSQEEYLKAYSLLDETCFYVDTNYDSHLEQLDRDASYFAIGSKYLTESENVPILFKNMRKDSEKYQKLTNDQIRHQIVSFHYTSGLYDYLTSLRKGYPIPEKIDLFLKTLDAQEKWIAEQLSPLLEAIRIKVPCSTSLKIWKHTFKARDSFLLPLHYDRSLFSLILHTLNEKEEWLRIFPNEEDRSLFEVRERYQPYPLREADFPLIFPGWAAKGAFGHAPTPHSVEGTADRLMVRYSYVCFIGKNSI